MATEFTRTGHASAPGKLMLAGEYAVLDGGRALAVALDGELQVKCHVVHDDSAPPSTTQLELHSNLWREPRVFTVYDDHDYQNFHDLADPFVDAALSALSAWTSRPAKVIFQVTGNLDPSHGAGSSSALRLAVLAAAKHITADSLINLAELADTALELQRRSQPAASGYDIAVQSRGGLIEFRQGATTRALSARSEQHLERLGEFVAIMIGGKGAPTGPTMKYFLDWLNAQQKRGELLELSETVVDAWHTFLASPETTALVPLIQSIARHRSFMAQSPVFPEFVADALAHTPGLDRDWTWKTTGAGGEDAVLLVGPRESLIAPKQALAQINWRVSPFNFTQQGLTTW